MDLEGGPGASAVRAARFFVASPLRERHDVILVDARGTGESAALTCAFQLTQTFTAYLQDFLPIQDVLRCRDALQHRADLTRYTSIDVVEDLEEVRRALGVERLNIYSTSGGTRVAQVYMRRHPKSVRAVLLHGPVPLDARIPLTFAADAQAALDAWLVACDEDSACHQAFPDPRAELAQLLERLTDRSVRSVIPDGSGNPDTVTLGRDAVAQVIRYMLYQPATAAAVPLYVHQAIAGDFESFARIAVSLGGIPSSIAMGFYLSSTCSEDVPWIQPAEAAEAAAGTFLGAYRYEQQHAACVGWPRRALPASYLDAVHVDIPTLIVVGGRDPVTPPRWAEEISAELLRARVVVVPAGGHGFGGLTGVECVDELEDTFFDTATPESLDMSCLTLMRPPPFQLAEPPEELATRQQARPWLSGMMDGLDVRVAITTIRSLAVEADSLGPRRSVPHVGDPGPTGSGLRPTGRGIETAVPGGLNSRAAGVTG